MTVSKYIAAFCILLMGVSYTAFAEEKNVGTKGGRYQLIQLSNMRRDQYLLDTQTGNLWSPTCIKGSGVDCQLSAWTTELVEGINITPQELIKKTLNHAQPDAAKTTNITE